MVAWSYILISGLLYVGSYIWGDLVSVGLISGVVFICRVLLYSGWYYIGGCLICRVVLYPGWSYMRRIPLYIQYLCEFLGMRFLY